MFRFAVAAVAVGSAARRAQSGLVLWSPTTRRAASSKTGRWYLATTLTRAQQGCVSRISSRRDQQIAVREENGLTPCDEPFPSTVGEWRACAGTTIITTARYDMMTAIPAYLPYPDQLLPALYTRAQATTRGYLALAGAWLLRRALEASQSMRPASVALMLRLRHVSHMHDSIQKLAILCPRSETSRSSARTLVDVLPAESLPHTSKESLCLLPS